MLSTKCILSGREHGDGLRFSVMSRHTLDDGLTPDRRITVDCFDIWLKVLAPPDKLVGDYYKRDLQWEEFERRYIEHLRMPNPAEMVQYVASLAIQRDISLLCIEPTPDYCHRRLLAVECTRYNPNLAVRCL